MRDRHADVLRDLLDHLAPRDRQAVRSAADRLVEALRPHGGVRDSTVLVGYGGGKDSNYTVAFVRAVQLFAARRDGARSPSAARPTATRACRGP